MTNILKVTKRPAIIETMYCGSFNPQDLEPIRTWLGVDYYEIHPGDYAYVVFNRPRGYIKDAGDLRVRLDVWIVKDPVEGIIVLDEERFKELYEPRVEANNEEVIISLRD